MTEFESGVVGQNSAVISLTPDKLHLESDFKALGYKVERRDYNLRERVGRILQHPGLLSTFRPQ